MVKVERTAVVGGPAKTVGSHASGHPAWRQVPNSDSSYSVKASMNEERYQRLYEVITNGLASSPHDWLKVEKLAKL